MPEPAPLSPSGLDRRFGQDLRRRRSALGLTQAELAARLRVPQASISRLESGARSASLPELYALAALFRCSVGDLLELPQPAALDEPAVLSQLAAHGIRLLGAEPAAVRLPLESVLLAALPHLLEPRLFNAAAVLAARPADWDYLCAEAERARLQNRLGALLAAAAAATQRERPAAPYLERLAAARLERREYFAPAPKTPEARAHLEHRTPPWLKAWHLYGNPGTRRAA